MRFLSRLVFEGRLNSDCKGRPFITSPAKTCSDCRPEPSFDEISLDSRLSPPSLAFQNLAALGFVANQYNLCIGSFVKANYQTGKYKMWDTNILQETIYSRRLVTSTN
jgi:hypothetical protein